MKLLNMIAKQVTRRIDVWDDKGSEEVYLTDPGVPADVGEGANVVTSVREFPNDWRDYFGPSRHAVLLDLDVPAKLIPSSTEGHSHLYVDVECSQEAYFRFLDAAAEVGIITKAYAEASQRKGASYLRLPWVKKGTKDGGPTTQPEAKKPSKPSKPSPLSLHYKHQRVLLSLEANGPMTVQEFCDMEDVALNQWAPKFSELRSAGLIERTGERRVRPTGCPPHVVRITEAGADRLTDLEMEGAL